MVALLAAHRAQAFPDEQYADLFSPVGRSLIRRSSRTGSTMRSGR